MPNRQWCIIVCHYQQVEKIVAKRIRQGKIEFLIKWRGYRSDENSWEPKENLIGCANAIREYNAYEKEMKKTSKTRVIIIQGVPEKLPS